MRQRIKVLVVDDSAVVRQTMAEILSSDRDIEVVGTAADPFIAAARLKDQVPDVITLDIEMPRMDGIELVRRIKQDEKLKSIPVMIVSYKDREEDRLRGLEAGADAYVTKSSFQEESWIGRVVDLVGEPEEGPA